MSYVNRDAEIFLNKQVKIKHLKGGGGSEFHSTYCSTPFQRRFRVLDSAKNTIDLLATVLERIL